VTVQVAHTESAAQRGVWRVAVHIYLCTLCILCKGMGRYYKNVCRT